MVDFGAGIYDYMQLHLIDHCWHFFALKLYVCQLVVLYWERGLYFFWNMLNDCILNFMHYENKGGMLLGLDCY